MKFFNKQKESKKNSDPIVRLLAPMIIGTLVCVICLASMTWAWFTASVDVKEQTIQAADRSTLVKVYEVAVTEDENQNPVETKTLVKPKEVPKKKDATETEEKPVEGLLKVDDSVGALQKKKLDALKERRDSAAVAAALANLEAGCKDESVNLMPLILEAVKTYATLGEICGVMRKVFGEYEAHVNL